jgi:hypothetical protein
LYVDADAIVAPAIRARYASLPSSVSVRGRDAEINYEVEEGENGPTGVARLRLPEKIARTLTEDELPRLDRPLRFIVTRGIRGAARANTLEELQEELDRPFTTTEIEQIDRQVEAARRDRRDAHRERRVRDSGEALKDHRKVQGHRGRRRKRR